MGIIYMNNDPEIREIFKFMGVISAYRCLLKDEMITQEEFDALVEGTKKEFDYDSLITYYDRKIKEHPSVKDDLEKGYKEMDKLRKEVKNNGTKKRQSKERD